MAKIKYRLGLDVGASSLGWCVYRLNAEDQPCGLVRMGSRIFPEGRDVKLTSLTAARRAIRQARRHRDRTLSRQNHLMQALVDAGLMPQDSGERKALEGIDPWFLRRKALDQPLEPHQIGRALYHLARRRGFRSNRKTFGREQDKENGKLQAPIAALRAAMTAAGVRTVGEYLANLHHERKGVRLRRGADKAWAFYIDRQMVADEFDAIWDAQAQHHPTLLTAAARQAVSYATFFQRPLRAVEPGHCRFHPDEYRMRLCAPLQQRFRMLQELNNIRVTEAGALEPRPLALDERNRMLAVLAVKSGAVTFKALGKAAGLRDAKFNLVDKDGLRDNMKGDLVGGALAAPSVLGKRWAALNPAQQYALAVLVAVADQTDTLEAAVCGLPAVTPEQTAILRSIFDPAERARVAAGLASFPFPLSGEQARAVAAVHLPDGYGELGATALGRIVPELERSVVTYDKAVLAAGYDSHSDFYTGEIRDFLPYYGEALPSYTMPVHSKVLDKDGAGRPKPPAAIAAERDERRYGRIGNPTVHIGLNQLRVVVNAIIKRYGSPHQIVIELARDLVLSGKKRKELLQRQSDNQKRNERLDEQLRKLGQRPGRENRDRLRLWSEVAEANHGVCTCLYTGKTINCTALFDGTVEVDHILPRGRSLDDSFSNKILCMREANREKGDRTPYEAWGHTTRWPEIAARVDAIFPPGQGRNRANPKRAKFAENAMEAFLGEGGLLARFLSDTAYFGRAAKRYLSFVCPPNCIWVSTGRLTALVRSEFKLNKLLSDDGKKNRNDHRHHAIDAAVIALCDRSMVQRVSTTSGKGLLDGPNRHFNAISLPWPSFKEDLARAVSGIVASHKPDHGTDGPFHNDTNYRILPDEEFDQRVADGKTPGPRLVGVHRSILDCATDAVISKIVGKRLREAIAKVVAEARGQVGQVRSEDGKVLKEPAVVKRALDHFAREQHVRHVFCKASRKLTVRPVCHRSGGVVRWVNPDANCCYEIYKKPDGKWGGEVINYFDAAKPDFDPHAKTARNGAELVMRLFRNDMVAIGNEAEGRALVVTQISPGKICMLPANEANGAERVKSGEIRFVQKSPEELHKLQGRAIGVDPLGYVNDKQVQKKA